MRRRLCAPPEVLCAHQAMVFCTASVMVPQGTAPVTVALVALQTRKEGRLAASAAGKAVRFALPEKSQNVTLYTTSCLPAVSPMT